MIAVWEVKYTIAVLIEGQILHQWSRLGKL